MQSIRAKLFLSLCAAAVLFASFSLDSAAQTQPQPEAAPPPSADLQTSVSALVIKIRQKLQAVKSDKPTEAEFADELAAFDKIIADNKNAKPDDIVQVIMMKVQFYVEVLKDYDKASAIVRRLKADYPQTQIAAHADEMLKEFETAAALQPGKVFPDFSVKDTNGQPLSISMYKGKVVLVDFWASWCPPCVAEMPNIVAMYEKYHDKGFEIVGINLDQEKEKMTEFVAKNKMPWAQYFDGKGWESELALKYGVGMLPTTFLLDGEGRIVARDVFGPALGEQLEKLLKK